MADNSGDELREMACNAKLMGQEYSECYEWASEMENAASTIDAQAREIADLRAQLEAPGGEAVESVCELLGRYADYHAGAATGPIANAPEEVNSLRAAIVNAAQMNEAGLRFLAADLRRHDRAQAARVAGLHQFIAQVIDNRRKSAEANERVGGTECDWLAEKDAEIADEIEADFAGLQETAAREAPNAE